MFLSKIVIRNYRNFSNFTLSLGQYNVIVGANKAGKSNLINALRLALDPNLPPKARRLEKGDFWDGGGEAFDGRSIIVSVEMTLESVEERNAMIKLDAFLPTKTPPPQKGEFYGLARFTYEFYPKENDITDLVEQSSVENSVVVSSEEVGEENDSIEIVKSYHPSQYDFLWYPGPESNRLKKDVNPQRLNRVLLLFILRALRDTEDLLSTWSRSPLKSLLESLNLSHDFLEEVAAEIHSEANRVAIATDVKSLMESIDARSSAMVGEIFSIGPSLNAVTNDSEDLLRSMKVYIDGEKQRPLEQASLGTLNILYFALLLEDMRRNRANKGQQTILTLEEPEAHIHPHVQRSLFRYFAYRSEPSSDISSNTLLVTTHSPHIVSVSPITSIVLLRDRHQQGTVPSKLNQSSFTRAEIQDIQRYMDVSRGELAFARGVIFVEGAAEQFLIPAFARAMRLDLDHLGISIVSVEGTDFKPYVKLVSEHNWNIPFAVITDSDHSSLNSNLDDDLEEVTISPGLSRASNLANLVDSSLGSIEERELLARKGFFVSQFSTLEVELVKTCPKEIYIAYRGLSVRKSARNRFRNALKQAIDELSNGQEGAGVQEVLKRIEQKGKGRFAQRLANLVIKNELLCPSYIRRCLRFIEAKSLESPSKLSMVKWK